LQTVNFILKNKRHEAVIRSYESKDQEAIQQFAKKIARETTHTLKYEAMPEMTRDQFAYQYDGVLKHPVNLTMGAF
jgi:hypothetical protein